MIISARKLLGVDTELLWESLSGDFTIQFDDGSQIETDAKETILTSYLWDMFRKYPRITLTHEHHLSSVLNKGSITARAFDDLLSSIFFTVYYTYTENDALYGELVSSGIDKTILREQISRTMYEAVNHLYNDTTYRLEEYVVTIDIEDFISLSRNPEILEKRSQFITETAVNEIYETVKHVVVTEPEQAQRAGNKRSSPVAMNIISRLSRSGIINQGQLDQVIGLRGFITDIDSYQFPFAVESNLTEGVVKFYESIIESRSASKSLAFTAKPLQETEYFNRRSQIAALPIRYLLPGDCGSTTYLEWKVRKSDLKNLKGKYYLNEETNTLDWIKGVSDAHLIGTTLKLRTSMGGCAHHNDYGVCEICFGRLANNFYRNTNLGQACTVEVNERISQAVLATKHLDGSSKIEDMQLTDEGKRYLMVRDGDTYLLNSRQGGRKLYLVISGENTIGFTDIREVSDVRDLSYSRTTQFNLVGFTTTEPDSEVGSNLVSISVGTRRRPASLSPDMIKYVREKGWRIDKDGRYYIDLKDWNHRNTLFIVPRRNVNMSDYSKEIAELLEATKDRAVVQERNNELSRAAFITELFDLVNSRLSVNLSVLEVMAYSSMVVNADPSTPDYALPKANTRYGFGSYRLNIENRSIGAMMAYEGQHDSLVNPTSFVYKNRIDSPMDIFICPEEVLKYYRETVPNYS